MCVCVRVGDGQRHVTRVCVFVRVLGLVHEGMRVRDGGYVTGMRTPERALGTTGEEANEQLQDRRGGEKKGWAGGDGELTGTSCEGVHK